LPIDPIGIVVSRYPQNASSVDSKLSLTRFTPVRNLASKRVVEEMLPVPPAFVAIETGRLLRGRNRQASRIGEASSKRIERLGKLGPGSAGRGPGPVLDSALLDDDEVFGGEISGENGQVGSIEIKSRNQFAKAAIGTVKITRDEETNGFARGSTTVFEDHVSIGGRLVSLEPTPYFIELFVHGLLDGLAILHFLEDDLEAAL
jgi:hypothetical protein